MKHLFIPYELAVIAKEKGFNDECLSGYDKDKQPLICNPSEFGILPAPLYQQIVDWFREKHNIYIEITLTTTYDFKVEIKGEGMELLYRTWKLTKEDYHEALNKSIEAAFKLI